ncbi:MAG: phosphoribosyltransferase family protein [Candidatus Micrarchaeota archaeon]
MARRVVKQSQACGLVAISHRLDSPGAERREQGLRVARRLLKGVAALQHRGTESCGLALGRHWLQDGNEFHAILNVRNLGLVDAPLARRVPGFEQAGNYDELTHLVGKVHGGVAHVRYVTSGHGFLRYTQPFPSGNERDPDFSIVFNGNLTNYHSLRRELEGKGFKPKTNVDTELIAELLRRGMLQQPARRNEPAIVRGVRYAQARLKGAYSVAAYTREGELVAFRDFLAYRPLKLGKLHSRHVVASETVALDAMSAKYVRDVEPGEIFFVGSDGRQKSFKAAAPRRVEGSQTCIFESIYFMHHNSVERGLPVWFHRARFGAAVAGKALENIRKADARLAAEIDSARESGPPEGVLVVPVPRSGIPQGVGLAMALGLRVSRQPERDSEIFGKAAEMARDAGLPAAVRGFARRFTRHALSDHPAILRKLRTQRSFIAPKGLQKGEVDRKFLFNAREVAGKDILLVDDTIVRGTTMPRLVRKLREAGARSVHVVTPAPPILAACFMGTAMNSEELIAHKALTAVQKARLQPEGGGLSERELKALDGKVSAAVAKRIGADSVTYGDIPVMLKAAGLAPCGHPRGDRACTSCFTGSYAEPVDAQAAPGVRKRK